MDYKLLFILFIITFMTFGLLSKLRFGSYRNPLFIYLLFWTLWILISIINPFMLYEVSVKTYILIFFSMISFSLSFIMFSKYDRRNNNELKNISLSLKQNRVIMIVQIIILTKLLLYLFEYNRLVLKLGVQYSRTIVYTQGFLFSSYIESLAYIWIIKPLVYLSGIFFISKYIIDRKIQINLIISIINIFIYSRIGNGRMMIFDFLCFIILVITFSFYNKKYKLKLMKKFKFRFLIIIIIFLYYITLSYANRMSVTLTFDNFLKLLGENIEQGLLYFIGPFVCFDIFLKNNKFQAHTYTFFKCILSGIDEFIGNILVLLGINYESGASILGNITSEPISIGINHQFNAFYTGLLNLYLDGGIIGIIVMSAIFGALIAVVYSKYLRHSSIYNLMILVYVTWMSIVSSYRLPSSLEYMLIFIGLIVIQKFMYKGEVKDNENFMVM